MSTYLNPSLYAEVDNYEHDYKGFSSSISHIFADPATARSDCCAIACCGVLQSDYNRYILHGKRPPSFKQRCLQHILVPLSVFMSAGYIAVTVNDKTLNQVLACVLMFFCISWTFFGCVRSSYKKCMFRRALLKKVMQRRNGVIVLESEDEDDENLMLPQTSFELMCAHRACGCYPSDSEKSTDKGDSGGGGDDDNQPQDLCGVMFKKFSDLFCGRLCSCHFQFCGTCALAQEGRQLDSMIHINKRRIDYVSLQFFTDYVNLIRNLRNTKDDAIANHFKALSKLSRMIVKTFIFIIVFVTFLSVAELPRNFEVYNLVVFLLTFLQAFCVLYLVHWQWNRFDLSLDAVIKYFACGFVLCVTSAIFFEGLFSVILQLVIRFVFRTTVQVANDNDYERGFLNYWPYTTFVDGQSPWNIYAEVDDYKRAFHRQHPILSIVILFIDSYFLAALVEEISKYYGFIMVEHPDFLTDSELVAAAEFSAVEDDDSQAGCGDAGGGDESEDDSEAEQVEIQQAGHCGMGGMVLTDAPVGNRHQTLSSRFLSGDEYDVDLTKLQKVELHPAPTRTFNSIGAGITIAMVSASVGFACCENLIYIFLYTEGNAFTQFFTLFQRSLFPIHPLCAAMQSIRVCKRQLENDRSMQLGRIIFPAIILHGTFDFSLMFFNFLISLQDEDSWEIWLFSILALLIAIFIQCFGYLYYIIESRRQVNRLNHLDAARNFVIGAQSAIIGVDPIDDKGCGQCGVLA